MSAPAVSSVKVVTSAAISTRAFDWRKTPGLGTYAVAIFLFLYAPLVVLMVFAFNAGDQVTVWTHFGFRWFAVVFANEQIQNAARDSLVIACVATIVSTALAVCAAMALERGIRFKGRSSATALVAMPLVVPEIVAAVSTLIFFSAIGLKLGIGNLIIAHTVFCIPFAILPIRARLRELGEAAEIAARDLYADELRVFGLITLPLLMPAILSGAMLAFVTSLDDFLISQMVADPGVTTLPMYIYGMIRLGVKPEVNAISTLLLGLSILLVTAAHFLSRRR